MSIDFKKELSKYGYNKGNSIDVETLINEILPELFCLNIFHNNLNKKENKNAKETAKELLYKFQYEVKDSDSKDGGNLMFLSEAKQCALICVTELLSLNIRLHGNEIENNIKLINFYQEVSKEIIIYENE